MHQAVEQRVGGLLLRLAAEVVAVRAVPAVAALGAHLLVQPGLEPRPPAPAPPRQARQSRARTDSR